MKIRNESERTRFRCTLAKSIPRPATPKTSQSRHFWLVRIVRVKTMISRVRISIPRGKLPQKRIRNESKRARLRCTLAKSTPCLWRPRLLEESALFSFCVFKWQFERDRSLSKIWYLLTGSGAEKSRARNFLTPVARMRPKTQRAKNPLFRVFF